jgi:hypothetical protein
MVVTRQLDNEAQELFLRVSAGWVCMSLISLTVSSSVALVIVYSDMVRGDMASDSTNIDRLSPLSCKEASRVN